MAHPGKTRLLKKLEYALEKVKEEREMFDLRTYESIHALVLGPESDPSNIPTLIMGASILEDLNVRHTYMLVDDPQMVLNHTPKELRKIIPGEFTRDNLEQALIFISKEMEQDYKRGLKQAFILMIDGHGGVSEKYPKGFLNTSDEQTIPGEELAETIRKYISGRKQSFVDVCYSKNLAMNMISSEEEIVVCGSELDRKSWGNRRTGSHFLARFLPIYKDNPNIKEAFRKFYEEKGSAIGTQGEKYIRAIGRKGRKQQPQIMEYMNGEIISLPDFSRAEDGLVRKELAWKQ